MTRDEERALESSILASQCPSVAPLPQRDNRGEMNAIGPTLKRCFPVEGPAAKLVILDYGVAQDGSDVGFAIRFGLHNVDGTSDSDWKWIYLVPREVASGVFLSNEIRYKVPATNVVLRLTRLIEAEAARARFRFKMWKVEDIQTLRALTARNANGL